MTRDCFFVGNVSWGDIGCPRPLLHPLDLDSHVLNGPQPQLYLCSPRTYFCSLDYISRDWCELCSGTRTLTHTHPRTTTRIHTPHTFTQTHTAHPPLSIQVTHPHTLLLSHSRYIHIDSHIHTCDPNDLRDHSAEKEHASRPVCGLPLVVERNGQKELPSSTQTTLRQRHLGPYDEVCIYTLLPHFRTLFSRRPGTRFLEGVTSTRKATFPADVT